MPQENNPKISVIMLTYNREDMVKTAIECIISQTFHHFEFIIVDNGSSDNSGKIADAYALQDTRIRVIHKERGNIGSGRNAGLDVACGDYIAFIDDDDNCRPDFLSFLYTLALDNKADVAICGATGMECDEKYIMTAEESVIMLMWRKHYTMAFPTKLFDRKLMLTLRFPQEGLYDDIAMMYRLLASANRVAYHGLAKYTFYRHESNNSAWTTNHSLLTKETLAEYLAAYRNRTVWLGKVFPNSAETFQYFEWSFMISMVEKITRLPLPDCYNTRDMLISTLKECQTAFLASENILPFEKEWMKVYVNGE